LTEKKLLPSVEDSTIIFGAVMSHVTLQLQILLYYPLLKAIIFSLSIQLELSNLIVLYLTDGGMLFMNTTILKVDGMGRLRMEI